MIKRIPIEQRKELRKRKDDKNKLNKLIEILIKKEIISQEDLGQ